MDNFTTCEDYFESLRISLIEKNITNTYIYLLHNNTEISKGLDIIGYTKIFAYAVIMIGGLLGNLNVILIVASVKSVRNAINLYVTNLAITDAMICIVCMLPHALLEYTGRKFIWGAFMCKFSSFTQTTCLITSVLTLCAISCDRFVAVFWPLHTRTTEKRTSVVIVIIWFLSVIVSSPFLFVKKHRIHEWPNFTEARCSEVWPISYYRDDTTNTCERKEYLRQIYHIMLSIAFYFLPILIMLVSYSTILYKIWTSRIPGEHSEANTQVQSRSKQKVLKMVIVVLIVFVICWTPLQVMLFLIAFGLPFSEDNHVQSWFIEFEWFSYYIAFANSFMNPFIYGHYNKDFKNKFCLFLCCRQRRRNKFWGANIFTKSVRSMNTTLSTLRSTTQAFISKRITKTNDIELPETAV